MAEFFNHLGSHFYRIPFYLRFLKTFIFMNFNTSASLSEYNSRNFMSGKEKMHSRKKNFTLLL